MTTDLFGAIAEQEPFKDIRNQRASVAEEKAALCATLNAMLRRSPMASSIASINAARAFKAEHKRTLTILKNPESSRQQLESAVNTMRHFYGEGAA
jgi:hypothetical protein